ncbi:MAG TPA: sigma-70 family RNA polymerase sigma factor [Vicinamibacteria bacterium]|jgi:RNA polymerase sigma-70 factor (ECF subfamily)
MMRRTGGRVSHDPSSALQVEQLYGLQVEEREAVGLSLDEAALIDRFLCGDETAFDQIVERYQDLVFNLSARLLGPDEAHDLSQEVFLQVYQKLGSFRREASLRTWIYRVVLNRAKNRQRWWRRREREMTAMNVEDAEREGAMELSSVIRLGLTPLPDRILERKELGEILQEAVATLPFEQRTVILLKELEGLSYEEISRTLNLAIGTVKSRLARARKALRERLDPELRGLSQE